MKKYETFVADTPGTAAQALKEAWEPLNGQCLNGGFVWFFRRELVQTEVRKDPPPPVELKKK